jgi:hypothetical protein
MPSVAVASKQGGAPSLKRCAHAKCVWNGLRGAAPCTDPSRIVADALYSHAREAAASTCIVSGITFALHLNDQLFSHYQESCLQMCCQIPQASP